MKNKPTSSFYILEGQCAGPKVCPLSRVEAGVTVCIKRLSTGPELSGRLREMGLCEEQQIKLVARDSSFICQVCNARLGISAKLAEAILVEAVNVPESVKAPRTPRQPRIPRPNGLTQARREGETTFS